MSTPKIDLINVIVQIFIPSKFVGKSLRIVLYQCILSALEIASIGSIFPILFLIVDPEVIERDSITKTIFELSRLPDHTSFFIAVLFGFGFFLSLLQLFKFIVHKKTFIVSTNIQQEVETMGLKSILSDNPLSIQKNHPVQLSKKSLALVTRYIASLNAHLASFKACIAGGLALVVLAFYDWMVIATILLIGFIYYILVFRTFSSRSRNIDLLDIELSGNLGEIWHDSIGLHHAFYLGNPLPLFQKKLKQTQNKIKSVRNRKMLFTFLPRLLLEFLFLISILLFVLHAFQTGKVHFIPYIALFGIGGLRVLLALDSIYQSRMRLSMTGSSITEVEGLYKKYEEKNIQAPESIPWSSLDLSISNFCHKGESKPLLTQASLMIEKGQHICIVGPSGSGKSTLLEILAGFYDNSCVVHIDKEAIKNLRSKMCLGFVQQKGYLYTGTLAQNVALGDEKIDIERVKESLQVACLEGFDDKLNLQLHDNTSILSMGQRQRLLIARELYRKPSILMLDESTSSLDQKTTDQLLRNLKDIDDLTIILTTHKQELMDAFEVVFEIQDQILKLRRGT